MYSDFETRRFSQFRNWEVSKLGEWESKKTEERKCFEMRLERSAKARPGSAFQAEVRNSILSARRSHWRVLRKGRTWKRSNNFKIM